jgi:hypothetical protein
VAGHLVVPPSAVTCASVRCEVAEALVVEMVVKVVGLGEAAASQE